MSERQGTAQSYHPSRAVKSVDDKLGVRFIDADSDYYKVYLVLAGVLVVG